MERWNSAQTTELDIFQAEKGILSQGEESILQHLNLQDKFTLRGMDKGFTLSSFIKVGPAGIGGVTRKEKVSFLADNEWYLYASEARALYSSKESTLNLVDEEQRRLILSRCPTLSGSESGGVYMTAIHEKISTPTDLRHLFSKMYLYMMDYTLAVISKSTVRRSVTNLTYRLEPRITQAARLASVATHDIVIDGEMFTEEQLSLLALAGEEYPSVKYGAEDNIYNTVRMDKDDLVIISAGDIRVDSSALWGSPDRMYQTMWLIAQKLNATGCLLYVLETMRGKCSMMRDLVLKTDAYEIDSMIPRSFCMSTAFGQIREKTVITNMGGYFTTSVSVVADLLYGMTFKGIASTVSESLGAMGKVVSSSTPMTNRTINSLMRDYGMQHTQSDQNYMLRNFEMYTRKPTKWDYGKWMKTYALQLASDMMNGLDIELPQMLLTVPGLTAVNTCFGVVRGWVGDGERLKQTKKERRDAQDSIAAVGWIAGLRKVRPQVFYNRSGSKQILINAQEREFVAKNKEDPRLRGVEFWIEEDLGGRVDDIEESGSSMFRSEFAGTRCAMVFNYEYSAWVEAKPQDYNRLERETFKGDLTEKEKSTMSKIQPTAINFGPAPSHGSKLEPALEHLRAISRPSAIIPSVKPRHTRSASTGEAVVPTYTEDGEERTTFKPYKRPVIHEGEEVEFSEINVIGDGRCGIHAVVKDLVTNGRLATSDAAKAAQIFSSSTASSTFHDANELAAQCLEWGMGMDLLDKESQSVVRFGTGGEEYSVTLIRDGAHFKAGRLGSGKNKMVVKRLEEQEVPNEEYVEKVRELGSLFGGSPRL